MQKKEKKISCTTYPMFYWCLILVEVIDQLIVVHLVEFYLDVKQLSIERISAVDYDSYEPKHL